MSDVVATVIGVSLILAFFVLFAFHIRKKFMGQKGFLFELFLLAFFAFAFNTTAGSSKNSLELGAMRFTSERLPFVMNHLTGNTKTVTIENVGEKKSEAVIEALPIKIDEFKVLEGKQYIKQLPQQIDVKTGSSNFSVSIPAGERIAIRIPERTTLVPLLQAESGVQVPLRLPRLN